MFGGPFDRAAELLEETLDEEQDVLEVAAGTGELTSAIAPRVGHLVATDYADAMVSELSEKAIENGWSHVECERADINDLPYESDRFDVVIAGNVIHLLPDLSTATDELCRVHRTDGVLVTPTFVHDETWMGWAVSRLLTLAGGPDDRHYDTSSLERTLKSEGLQIRRAETIPGILPMANVETVVDDADPNT